MPEKPHWLERRSGRIAFIPVMIALTTVANLVMVPMPQPLAEYDLSPVLIYALGVLLDPLTAGLIVTVAQGIGTTIKALNFGWPLVFIPGAMGVRGIEAALISWICRLRKEATGEYGISRLEVMAMIVGVVWETLGFTVADVILFGPGMAAITLLTVVDAVFIPVAITVVVVLRRVLRVHRIG